MSYKLGRNVSLLEAQQMLDDDTLLLLESAWVDGHSVVPAKELRTIGNAIGIAIHIIEREGEPDMMDFINAWQWWDNLDKDEKIAQRPDYE